MCTAVSFHSNGHFFGRNLDLEYSNNENVIITPQNYPFIFRNAAPMRKHYALIGIGIVTQAYPLYYDSCNEYGLAMAGLNFPHYAVYLPCVEDRHNIAPFEVIPWILGQCKSVKEALCLLNDANIAKIAFGPQFPLSPLHWLLSDAEKCVTLEPMKDGLHIHENPIGILTNSPDFRFHYQNLSNYMHLNVHKPKNHFNPNLQLFAYSNGMGGMGLPGDLSSTSRFIRAAFTKSNAIPSNDEFSSVSQFFHILGSVSQTKGCVEVNGKYEKTIYTCCCNTKKGIYYYKTYENHQINAIDLFKENLDSSDLIQYNMRWQNNILFQN